MKFPSIKLLIFLKSTKLLTLSSLDNFRLGANNYNIALFMLQTLIYLTELYQNYHFLKTGDNFKSNHPKKLIFN